MPVLSPTIEQASAYFATRLYSDVWDRAIGADKRKALSWASRIIEGSYVFTDEAYTEDTWDPRILYAVYEEAIWLLTQDPTVLPEVFTKGIVSASAGGVSATFSKEHLLPLVCGSARALIGDLGTLISGEGRVTSTML